MSSRLDVPVLMVDWSTINRVDPRDAKNLHNMWAVFSNCAESLEEGKRLENFSWRLWNRETLCCDSAFEAERKTPAPPTSSMSSSSRTLHDLQSGSLTPVPCHPTGNITQVDTIQVTAIQPTRVHHGPESNTLCRQPKSAAPRHTTASDLEKMVKNITKKNDLRPLPDIGSRNAAQTPTSATKIPPASIFCGPSLSQAIFSGHFNPPPYSIPTADITAATPSQNTQPKSKTIFALGGSSEEGSCDLCPSTRTSSREDFLPRQFLHSHQQSQQPQPQPQPQPQKKKNAMFSFGGSSNEEDVPLSWRSMNTAAITTKPFARKSQALTPTNTNTTIATAIAADTTTITTTTFPEEISRGTPQEEAIPDEVSDSDEEDVDENAIDDEDDSSDWEDSVEGSGNPSIDDKNLFQRVDSRVNLTSRRSLITTMLHQNDRRNAMIQAAMNSKSTSDLLSSKSSTSKANRIPHEAHGLKDSPLLSINTADTDTTSAHDLTPNTDIPRSEARPIVRYGPSFQNLALSPRTTRRNMLASELTVSLRQHLLWERKQKSQTANAVLKRRHTAQDVAQLKQYPETSFMGKDEAKGSYSEYYEGMMGEYNSRGW